MGHCLALRYISMQRVTPPSALQGLLAVVPSLMVTKYTKSRNIVLTLGHVVEIAYLMLTLLISSNGWQPYKYRQVPQKVRSLRLTGNIFKTPGLIYKISDTFRQ